jgi:hypothetical protein
MDVIKSCFSPIRNDGKSCGCNHDQHAREYKRLTSFVKEYNSIRDIEYHISVSRYTYDNLSKYKFIRFVEKQNILNIAFHCWLHVNRFIIAPKYTCNIQQHINIDVVNDDESIFDVDTVNDNPDSVLDAFVELCNHKKSIDQIYNCWLKEMIIVLD